ncbi:melanopsin-like [Aplysia californica]|uniref:Melanopsin-like n=1 Tax=Aplysia californica TaxID=6500 RepID=A0ABM0JPZ2_APLCA|nr:melanopsin-like [Aplysia californica]
MASDPGHEPSCALGSRQSMIIVSTIYICLGVFIFFENIITIMAIRRTPSLHTNPNLYMFSLAVSDVLVGATAIFLGSFVNPTVQDRVTSTFPYLASLAVTFGMVSLSFAHMAVIAVDRYIYIGKPYLYERCITRRVIFFQILCLWVSGAVYTIAPMIVYREVNVGFCILIDLPPEYTLYAIGIAYFILLVVVLIAYYKIARVVLQHRRSIANQTISLDRTGEDLRNRKRQTSALKSVRFFAVVFGFFFGFTLPTVFCMYIESVVDLPYELYAFLIFIAPANSSMNTLVFALMNKEFRKAVKKIFVDLRCLKVYESSF